MKDGAAGVVRCPSCAEAVVPGDAFCESCGAPVATDPAGAATADDDTMPMGLPATLEKQFAGTTFSPAPGIADSCIECGGDVLDDGFCSQCGKKAPSPRDHFRESPVDWIGGVCDKGILHARNEDAMALAGLADRSFAVLVVCDGVTSAPDSDRAALAAAREACAALVSTPLPATAGVAATVSHWSAAISRAAADANAATIGVARSLGDPVEPPSCTFVAAVLHRDVVTVGWCGDSRAYWLPDEGPAVALTLDHSLGTEMMQRGMSQAEAETDSTFHTITRWLGADSVDPTAETSSRELREPGWLLVCSDGLWNYASPPAAVRTLLDEQLSAGHTSPLALAAALVRWANEQGGHDNITAVLARHEPSLR